MPAPLVVVNAVGLTPRLLPHAPRLAALGPAVPMRDVVPAVTMSAQATMLTGQPVERHGVVGNGWLSRDTNEVRFWQQSNRLMQAEPVYATARRRARERGRSFTCAKLFWWFNQGADVDVSVTPKPHYGIDGNKVFGITGTPDGYSDELERRLGRSPRSRTTGPPATRSPGSPARGTGTRTGWSAGSAGSRSTPSGARWPACRVQIGSAAVPPRSCGTSGRT